MSLLRRLGEHVVHAWEALQVELHGKYSVERLFNLKFYSECTSTGRAMAVLFLTPLPCLAAVIGTELIALQPPERGLAHSSKFWLRVFLTTWMMNFTVLEQCRFLIPRLPMTVRQNVLVSLFSSGGGTCFVLGLSYEIGFPLPFLIALGSPGCCVLLLIACKAVWGKHVRGNSALQAELKNYVLVAMAQLTMTYVYPAYNFVFVSLSSSSQTGFAMLLPVMKILAKNAMSYLFRATEDFKPEMVIFNVEIFHALFVAYCMQSSTSINTTIVLMATDFFQACLSLYDVDRILRDIYKVIIVTHLKISESSRGQSDHDLSDKRKLTRDWGTLDLVVKIVQSDKKMQDDNTLFRFESQALWADVYEEIARDSSTKSVSRSGSRSGKPRALSRNSIMPSKQSLASSRQAELVAPVSGESDHAPTTFPPQPMPEQEQERAQQHQQQRKPRKSSFALLFSSSECIKPTGEEQRFIDAMSDPNKVVYVQKMLQLLHLTEYLLLIEFTEVMVPIVYCE